MTSLFNDPPLSTTRLYAGEARIASDIVFWNPITQVIKAGINADNGNLNFDVNGTDRMIIKTDGEIEIDGYIKSSNPSFSIATDELVFRDSALNQLGYIDDQGVIHGLTLDLPAQLPPIDINTGTTGTLNNSRLPPAISVATLAGDGSGITGLTATQIPVIDINAKTSGTLNNGRLPPAISVATLAGDGSGITGLTATQIPVIDINAKTSGTLNNGRLPPAISVASLAGNGSGLTDLNASNITTGTITNDRLPATISQTDIYGDYGIFNTAGASTIIAAGILGGSPVVPPPSDLSYQSDSHTFKNYAGTTTYVSVDTGGLLVGSQLRISENGTNTVAIGRNAGQTQGTGAVAIGNQAGQTNQGFLSVAIGQNAGQTNQGGESFAMGHNAGASNQADYCFAFGTASGFQSQGEGAIAIGWESGKSNQGEYAVAIGYEAGLSNQGIYSVAIGNGANAPAQSVVLNGTGGFFAPSTANGFFVKPVKSDATKTIALTYDSATGEIFNSTLDMTDATNLTTGTISNDRLPSVIRQQNIYGDLAAFGSLGTPLIFAATLVNGVVQPTPPPFLFYSSDSHSFTNYTGSSTYATIDVNGLEVDGRCRTFQDYTIGSSTTTHLNPQLRIGNATITGGSAYVGYSGRGNSDIINAATYWRTTGGLYDTAGYFGIAVNNQSGNFNDGYGITEGELDSQTHLVVNDAGRVGIGTTDPHQKLDVRGGNMLINWSGAAIIADGTTYNSTNVPFSVISNPTSGVLTLGLQNSTTTGTPASLGFFREDTVGNSKLVAGIYSIDGTDTNNAADGGLDFRIAKTGNSGGYDALYTAMTVDSYGNLNFGSDTRQMINLYKTSGTVYGIGVQSGTQYFRTDFNFAWYRGGSHNDGSLNNGGGTTLMTLNSAGNLDVYGDGYFAGNLNFGSVTRQMINLYSTAYGIGVQAFTKYFRTGGNFAWYIGGSHNDGILNNGGGTTLMTLNSAGNLGIGTSPSYKLHVNGNGYFADQLLLEGSLTPSTSLRIRGTSRDCASEDPSLSGYAQLEISSIYGVQGGTFKQGNLQIGFDHRPPIWGCGFLQGIVDFEQVSPIALNPAGGNIGIGTDRPGSLLQIVGDSADCTGTLASNDGYAQLEILSASNVSGASRGGNLHIGFEHRKGSLGCGFMQAAVDQTFYTDIDLQPQGGRVGIRTTAPQAALDVTYSSGVTGISYGVPSTWNQGGIGTTSTSSSGGGGGYIFGNDINHSIFFRRAVNGATDVNAYYQYGDHVFYTGGLIENQSERLRINSAGNITYTGTLSQSSDDRLKHNEEPVVDALGTINRLRLLKYDKTDKMLDADFNGDLGDIPHHKEFGFIAQEVLEIPELAFLVRGGGTEQPSKPAYGEELDEDREYETVEVPYNLDYQGITNVAIQAIQELSAQVKTQQEQINSLLQIVDELRQEHAATAP